MKRDEAIDSTEYENQSGIGIAQSDISRKWRITVCIISLVIILVSLINIFTVKPIGFDILRLSDDLICLAAAEQLNKNIAQLNRKDYAKITVIDLSGKLIYRVKAIKKFKKLKKFVVNLDVSKTPRWMEILSDFKILDLSKHNSINIYPLSKLKSLEILVLKDSKINNIRALSKLKNLRQLNLERTKISDIKPLQKLVNLEELNLNYTKITDLEPLKGMVNLRQLKIQGCGDITSEQIQELQESLPELKISSTLIRTR